MRNTAVLYLAMNFQLQTLSFPELLKSSSNDECCEDVSYDIESLFTSFPVQETIDYMLQRIYVRTEIKRFWQKPIFKKLLSKLTKEYVFSVNDRIIKQIGGCPMGCPISVVFSDIYVSKMEEDIVAPMKSHFYKRYVADTYIRKNNEPQSFFQHVIVKKCQFGRQNAKKQRLTLTKNFISYNINFLTTLLLWYWRLDESYLQMTQLSNPCLESCHISFLWKKLLKVKVFNYLILMARIVKIIYLKMEVLLHWIWNLWWYEGLYKAYLLQQSTSQNTQFINAIQQY